MRVFPSRREVLFILAFVVFFVLFLQFGLGTLEVPQYSAPDWSRGIAVPWGGERMNQPPAGAHKTSLDAPANFRDSSGVERESAFIWKNGKVPTTEIRLHVPGGSCRCTGDEVMKPVARLDYLRQTLSPEWHGVRCHG